MSRMTQKGSVRMSRPRWAKGLLALALSLTWVAGPALAQADPDAAAVRDLLGVSASLGLDWEKLFDENGRPKDVVDAAGRSGSNRVPDYVDWYGGIEVAALEDNISAGAAVDMSAVRGATARLKSTVFNGIVSAAHDLGNSYMYTTLDSLDNLVIYLGVERLSSQAETGFEIELNQDRIRIGGGIPWHVRGARVENDLLVRVSYSGGAVSSVEVSRWSETAKGGSWLGVALYGGLAAGACNGEPGYALFCSGRPPIAAAQDVRDSAGNQIQTIPPDDFFEIGVNVVNLLGSFVDYTAIQLRTAEDIALGNFRATGYWGEVGR